MSAMPRLPSIPDDRLAELLEASRHVNKIVLAVVYGVSTRTIDRAIARATLIASKSNVTNEDHS